MSKVDHTKFTYNGKPSPSAANEPKDVSPRWWTATNEADQANGISASIQTILNSSKTRDTQSLNHARLYGNLSLVGMAGLSANRWNSSVPDAGRITFNVVQSCVDTVTSKITKNKPKPYFLTSGGNYKQQRKAKKLNTFIDGIFYENNYYRLAGEVFKDACVFGTGVIHVFNKDGRVAYERVLSTELFVDELEAFYGKPRQMHRVKLVDRHVLAAALPEKANLIIERASGAQGANGKAVVSDMVEVRESWHLASGPDAEDGKHVISIAGHVLFAEEWTNDFFPFAFLHWNKRLYGHWGQGLAEQLQGIQLELNKLLWLIQLSYKRNGSYKVLINNTSKIVKEHFNPEVGAMITYQGEKPEWIVPNVISGEVYNHLQTLKSSAYELSGISQLSASSTKPQGLNSGKALREMDDIQSDRFMTVSYGYQDLALDVARLSISTTKEIVEAQKAKGQRGKYSVAAPGKKFLATIDWKEVCLPEDAYVMQCFPVSSLPQDPAGRLQTIQEYVQAGFLNPRQGRRLLDFPDLESVEGLANAAEDYLAMILDQMVDEGEYTAPEPYDDLQLAREMATEYYQFGKTNGLEEERLELLRRFMSQVDDLVTQASQPDPNQAPPGGPPGAVPPANPTAAPQSDLIPNVNQ